MNNRINTEALRELVNRMRQLDRGWPTVLSTAADAIEQLEAERKRWKAMAGDATYTRDAVHRLVKRALEEAADRVALYFREYKLPIGQRSEGAHLGIAGAIRSLSPDEIMKKGGL